MMRDPKRIEEILDLISKIWHRYPDWRLGQLIVNATNCTGDMFFYEDDRLLECLQELENEE